MCKSLSVKVCGLTEEKDVELALSLGADFLGFIVYPKSLRALTLERAASLAKIVPKEKRVLVDVETNPDNLKKYQDAGFDQFQIHANLPLDPEMLTFWSNSVGRQRLWLAPRLPPDAQFPEWILKYADTILLDTYSKNQIGGTGHTGDFKRFASLKQQFPDNQWILAGGLSANNVVTAIECSTANRIDVNSCVESNPGKKDPAKLREFFQVLHGLRE